MSTFDVGALVAAILALSVMIEQIVEGIWAIVEAVIIAIGTKIVKASGKHPLTHCQRLKALADALAYKKGDVSVAPKIPADADLDDKQKSREPTATAPAPHKSEVAVRTTTSLAKLYQQLRALNAAAKAKRGGRPAPADTDKLGDGKRQAKHMQRMQAGWGEFKKVFSSVMGVGIGIGIAYIGGNTISIAQLNTRAVHIATGVVAGLLAPYSHQLQQLFFKLQKGSSEK